MNTNTAKAIAFVAVCFMGAYVMDITEGQTGIGWAFLSLWMVWGNA